MGIHFPLAHHISRHGGFGWFHRWADTQSDDLVLDAGGNDNAQQAPPIPLISTAVKDGSVAYLLNKPFNFLLYHFSVGLEDSLTNMIFNLLAGGTLVWLMESPPTEAWGWPLVLMTMILAWIIDFCFAALIGLAAFVVEEVAAFDWIYQKLLFIPIPPAFLLARLLAPSNVGSHSARGLPVQP